MTSWRLFHEENSEKKYFGPRINIELEVKLKGNK